ncbi:MAG: type II toxin-antitoxin system RelE/ParE family toxin [Phycisphaerae bacterium]|nr:type II toxin-antitoxin system RelE/ParE family toxin [Tepidisphaeraceae bacterium]
MKGYELTTEAQFDLEAIAEYIAAEASIERALIVLADIRAEFRKLADMPGMGHYREDLLDQRYKFWSVYDYVIAYKWEVEPIRILAVVHGARNLDAFFSRRVK